MKRLTKWIDDGENRQAIPDPEIRSNGHGKCCNKLAEYEDLEEQGRLLRLPCKVGDAVYYLDRFCGSYSSDCPSRPCENCQDYEIEIHEGKFMLSNIDKFGKTVFLTEEEAENKLKKMEEKS